MDPETPEYQQRQAFIQKIYEFKCQKGVLHFDARDILRENGVGLWLMRLNEENDAWELHVDETMERMLAIDVKHTSRACYEYWRSHIHPEDCAAVQNRLSKMISDNQAHQIDFRWRHPEMSDVMVHLGGKRVSDADGMIVLEGYCRMITHA